jgi:hypothetical protein
MPAAAMSHDLSTVFRPDVLQTLCTDAQAGDAQAGVFGTPHAVEYLHTKPGMARAEEGERLVMLEHERCC